MVDSNLFYIWRNSSEQIVCISSYSVTCGQTKISHVYTPKKAYASNLIYGITEKILDNGSVPLLYTNYNYSASNKAYVSVGYESMGITVRN